MKKKKKVTNMNGVVLVNKEKFKTSRDMVNELNHIFRTKKIGHTGTLDPIATGVLVMCIGKYTKLVDLLSALEKEYIAEIKLGTKTDTLDITGNVLETCEVKKYEESFVNEVLQSFVGKFEQEIPIYSAKKINGKKLYEYARNGEDISLPKNTVEIYNIELLAYEKDIIKFKVRVSKGTYIRSLISSICEKLDTLGTMNDLIRSKQGKYSIEESFTIDDIKNDKFRLLNVRELLDYQIYNLNDEEYFKVKNGSKISINSDEKNLIMIYNDEEIAIYKKENELYRASVMLI